MCVWRCLYVENCGNGFNTFIELQRLNADNMRHAHLFIPALGSVCEYYLEFRINSRASFVLFYC